MVRLILILLSVIPFNLMGQESLDSIRNVKMGKQISDMIFYFLNEDVNYSLELDSLANSGDVSAQNALGMCYLNGKGILKDGEKAVFWFSEAAAHYNNNALCNLGYCYENGIGVSKNDFQAYSFYKTAALNGHADAASYLGRCYLKGIGTEVDLIRARAWFEKCAETGDYVAQSNAGQLYYHENNFEKAIYWLTKASDKSAIAAELLGDMYENGIGTQQNHQVAKEIYQKSYNLGNESVKDKIK